MMVLNIVVAAVALTVATPSESISRTAQGYLGERYIYGDSGTHGFDCSGFVQTVFRENGYDLPRTSAAQGSLGKSIKTDDIRPGDLLFFARAPGSRHISHVGIALDHNHMIHASRKGHRILISKWNRGYYSKRLIAARRVKS